MKVFILLCALFALALAQTRPLWPKAASASIHVQGYGERREERHFFRWFYDEAAGKERFEGPHEWRGEFYWSIRILDTVAKKEWFVVFQEGLVECFTGADNHSLPHPHFERAHFVGKAEIDYTLVDHWIERDGEGRELVSIFDRADNGEIKRIDMSALHSRRPHAVTIHFHEIDEGTQDPTLWTLPAEIQSICNNVSQ
eukprot:TRINITY_DN2880_c0_g1_i7.p1 TRINITY_DN2880_c0_g1~~TRINITY_DN2880_c0_g1_i7.p1  ORF type:complete len:198 (-),score=29.12 TRINITY_DN2880_c0_g1_i7:19-612(-)